MTDEDTPEISADEVDWKRGVVHEGRQPGAVVSVRLDPAETAQLRRLAELLGMTLSQVLRRALAAYEPERESDGGRKLFVGAFTYGGTTPPLYEQAWQYTYAGSEQLRWPTAEKRESGSVLPTATEPTRIVERVTV